MNAPHRHPQVPVLWFECDEEIADLITLMNYCGVRTTLSCQNNRDNQGRVRRVWAEILGEDPLRFLAMLDRPDEVSDLESLSHRMATEKDPDDWRDFREDRAWHYKASVDQKAGELLPLRISIRFPYTDLAEVVARLRTAAREIAGFAPDDGQVRESCQVVCTRVACDRARPCPMARAASSETRCSNRYPLVTTATVNGPLSCIHATRIRR